MKAAPRQALLLALVATLAAALSPASAVAQDVVFGEPEAQAELGRQIVFSTSLTAPAEPHSVELLLRLPTERAVEVIAADVSAVAGGWRAEATLEGSVPPNTRFSYRFRLREPTGETVLGPEADVLVVDRRFAWRTIEGPMVRVHWYEGDEDFARRALDIGERAVQNAAELLGVEETEPIDFFIYASEPDFRTALGPGTRENVGGQAHSSIRTMFGLVEPHQRGRDLEWLDVLVAHELTHLVFDTATDNPYHAPPRWLNEGVAVYLSEGYNPRWQAVMERAVRQGSVIPLDGLGGLFPTTREQFELAYAESVAAVDYFIAEYGEPTLWSLVLSYAGGVSDDEAFRAATGADLAAFNAAWMASLGVEVPQPLGPQPGAPGPLPPGWDGAPATPPPGGPGATAAPPTAGPSPDATAPPATPVGEGAGIGVEVAVGLGLIAVVALVGLAWLARRRLLT